MNQKDSIQRNDRINNKDIHISASERNCIKTNNNNIIQNYQIAKAEKDNRQHVHQLEAENKRLKDILKTNSLPLDHKIEETLNNKSKKVK